MFKVRRLLLCLIVISVSLFLSVQVMAQDTPMTGNVIFIHPDGTGPNHWGAARMYWYGPDANSPWDLMPHMALYRGHMSDRLTGTSNGGATVHAFGYKVVGPGSYGQDGGGDEARPILSLSGFSGSIMREAAAAGYPVGIVNDGDIPEPGTGVFLAEVSGRDDPNEIARQIIDGRPGFEGEAQPVVVLGGGEAFFLPINTPRCEGEITPACTVHVDPVDGTTAAREDERNLIQEAVDAGWVVVRTRAEFDALRAELEANADYAPQVLGLFAADDIFNDEPEELLISLGLVDESIATDDKRGQIIGWRDVPGSLGYNPPTADEMTEVALIILERRSITASLPFMLVTEVESTDNMGNNDNAIGTLTGAWYANGAIAAAQEFQARNPNTLILTAADSDAGGMQIISPAPTDEATAMVTGVNGNPTGVEEQDLSFPVDGIMGRNSMPFMAEADAFGTSMDFAIAWIGGPDVAGGIISRAQGMNAELLNTEFASNFDSTDVYRLMYMTLFGEMLADPTGVSAPDRGA
jgi:alkaline phosphatase